MELGEETVAAILSVTPAFAVRPATRTSVEFCGTQQQALAHRAYLPQNSEAKHEVFRP
jgi:hypothetical protein